MACLVEGGYAAATTLRVQTCAEVSRGRLLHHFPSRDELLVAAALHLVARQSSELLRDVDGIHRDGAEPAVVIDRTVEFAWASFHHAYFWATTELWVAARTNPSLADVLLPAERAHQPHVRAAMDRLFGAELVARPRYPLLRDMLVTSMRGAALEYAFTPRAPAGDPRLPQWKVLARTLLLDDDD